MNTSTHKLKNNVGRFKSFQTTAESKTARNLSDDFMFWGILANFILIISRNLFKGQ